MIKLFTSIKKRLLPLGKDHGIILVTVMVAATALFIVGLSLLSNTTSQSVLTNQDESVDNAVLTAEAGIEQTIQDLKNGVTTGYPTDTVFFDNTTGSPQGQGYGVFNVTVTPSGSNKILTATGKVYTDSTKTKLISQRIIQVTLTGGNSGIYSVAGGPGGLILSGNNALLTTNLYVGGTVAVSGNASIGSSTQPVNMNVANIACPASGGPTYPQPCTGTQPISLGFLNKIYGTVCATGQTSSTNIVPTSGLQAGCVAPIIALPTYDRAAQIAAIPVANIKPSTDTSATGYLCPSSGGARTWPAPGIELTGATTTISNSCSITIDGNVYIPGNLKINGQPTFNVDDSMGSTDPVVLVDGTITISGQPSFNTNMRNAGIRFISFKSGGSAACSATSSCTSLTGSDLKTSQTIATINLSTNSSDMSAVNLYSYWGEVQATCNNQIGDIIGQTLSISGQCNINYNPAASAGSSAWSIVSYQQLPNP